MMDESRKQFEDWYQNWFGEPPLSGWEATRTADNGYSPERINDMWEAWQASRQSLEDNQ